MLSGHGQISMHGSSQVKPCVTAAKQLKRPLPFTPAPPSFCQAELSNASVESKWLNRAARSIKVWLTKRLRLTALQISWLGRSQKPLRAWCEILQTPYTKTELRRREDLDLWRCAMSKLTNTARVPPARVIRANCIPVRSRRNARIVRMEDVANALCPM